MTTPTTIRSLQDLRPGDIMFGPIGGLAGVGVGLGQLLLGEGFSVGPLKIRHVGIVVEASVHHEGVTLYDTDRDRYMPIDDAPGPLRSYEDAERAGYVVYRTGVMTAPKLVQAMPGGAEEVKMRHDTHWTAKHTYARLPEDWPGQALDAAHIARLMVEKGVAYSPASYAALAAWRLGMDTPRLEAWIGRRQSPAIRLERWSNGPAVDSGHTRGGLLPMEAICSVLVDQAWTLAGKKVMTGVGPQCVTPGALASRILFGTDGVTWGWPARDGLEFLV